MAKTKKAAPVTDEVEELEAEESTGSSMLSAKEAAAAIGTDARTLRKFLRSQHGLVGQGQRWGISPDDLPKLKAQFQAKAKSASTKADGKVKKGTAPAEDLTDEELEDMADLDDLEEIEDDDEVDL